MDKNFTELTAKFLSSLKAFLKVLGFFERAIIMFCVIEAYLWSFLIHNEHSWPYSAYHMGSDSQK